MSTSSQVLIFWGLFLALSGLIIFMDQKYGMLRDSSTAFKKPFSFARVQLAWWTVIVLSSFLAVMITKQAIPTFDTSTLVLLGISAATTGAARIIDQSDQKNPALVLAQNHDGENFFLDILSDATGPNVHRFQTVVFNLAFGVWFIWAVLQHLTAYPHIVCPPNTPSTELYNCILPIITPNNLVLLGLSAGTYAALKTTENKSATGAMPDMVPDESGNGAKAPAQG